MTATTHQALYRRWRAQTFAEIVGQDAVVTTLRNAVRTGRVAHALLFTGPRGTGKTSLARIVAKALNCTDLGADGDPCDRCPACTSIREGNALDVVEIDAASNRGINEVRELRDRLAYAPAQLRRKVYILDEAHQITKDAWNALLKSLEEPPEFVTFMFASTHPQDFPPAILSRLQRFDVRRLTEPEIAGKLERILAADGRAAEPDAVALVARLAAGGMRDAESILDQLLSTTGGTIEAATVRDLLGMADAETVESFVDALVDGDAAVGIAILDRLDERGRDVRILLDQTVDALRARLLADVAARQPSRAGLTAVAARLAGLDPTRLGPGGLRLQLELALLERATRTAPVAGESPAAVAAPAPTAAPRTAAPPGDRDERGPRPSRDARRAPAAAAEATPTSQPAPAPPVATEPSPPTAGPESDPAPAQAPEPAPTLEPEPDPEPAPEPAAAGDLVAAAVGTDGTPADGDLDRLRLGWAQIVAGSRPVIRALISECRPLAVEGAIVTLGFPESKGFLKDHTERKRGDLEATVGTFLGHDVTVRCVATNLEILPPLPGDTEAETILAEARRIFAEDLVDVGEVR